MVGMITSMDSCWVHPSKGCGEYSSSMWYLLEMLKHSLVCLVRYGSRPDSFERNLGARRVPYSCLT